jgi:polar amino acid transport system permease protein
MSASYFDLISRSAPLFAKGAWMTLQVLLMAGVLSFAIGVVLGAISCTRLKVPVLSPLAEGFSFVARGIPFFVQLLIIYFVLPDLFGFNLDPFPASVIALGICSSGYVAQFVRGGLNAIPIAQWEAAYALGYDTTQALRRIILPQMMRFILPSLNNELDALLKSTAVISSIGLLELTRVGMNLVSREMEPVPIYLTLAFFYLCMSGILNLITKQLEKRIPYVKH